ncbi:MAG: hypothetical protein ACTIJD_08235 [Staphylococcus saprophyticus]
MKNKLILFRNELKSKYPPKYKVIGIVTEIVLSTEIFKKNRDIVCFIDEVFEVEFKEYVITSRTNIIARLSRIIVNSNDDLFNSYKKNLNEYINKKILKNQIEKNSLKNWEF